tara:strand:+ start:304 stop:483 length:180 start_codon:yes stop_codon:yes gene_type:complete
VPNSPVTANSFKSALVLATNGDRRVIGIDKRKNLLVKEERDNCKVKEIFMGIYPLGDPM